MHITLAGLLLAFTLSIFGAVVYGVYMSRAAVEEASLSLADKRAQQQKLVEAVQVASETKPQRASLDKLIIPPGGSGAFIASVESIGNISGVTYSVFSVDAQGPRKGSPGNIVLSVQFSGGYAACIRFLRLIETMPESVAVSSFSLQYGATTGTWGGTLGFSALSFDTP